MPTARVQRAYRTVRVTARTSALLFAAAQAAAARGRPGHAAGRLYLGFMAAHAVHFAAVTRYARMIGGRNLFPGGRSLSDVGGWRTVAGIYGAFAGLAVSGWAAGVPAITRRAPRVRVAGGITTKIIATMFVGTYLGQLRRSPFYAVPAALVAAATLARSVSRPVRWPAQGCGRDGQEWAGSAGPPPAATGRRGPRRDPNRALPSSSGARPRASQGER